MYVQIYGVLPVNFVTAPGWLMCVSWGLYLLLIVLFFKEPDRSTATYSQRRSSSRNLDAMPDNTVDVRTSSSPSSLRAPLLPGNGQINNHPPDSSTREYSSDADDSRGSVTEVDDSDCSDDKAVETVSELLKELTRPVKILLSIYFMLKFASELLISESSILTDHYFKWKTSQVTNAYHYRDVVAHDSPSTIVVSNYCFKFSSIVIFTAVQET